MMIAAIAETKPRRYELAALVAGASVQVDVGDPMAGTGQTLGQRLSTNASLVFTESSREDEPSALSSRRVGGAKSDVGRAKPGGVGGVVSGLLL